jgi:hypothetical protein
MNCQINLGAFNPHLAVARKMPQCLLFGAGKPVGRSACDNAPNH